ncbi:MAG: glycosyltransferase family 9 protein [Syntrophorhabdales bacterium]|jgi:hypothetical protein
MSKNDTGQDDQSLFIHPGGLGDVCLSESTILSLKGHFGTPFRAVGTKRVLDLFGGYFTSVDSLDRRTWAYLFSDSLDGPSWRRVVFIGKDRGGSIRARLSRLTGELIFIDMYPDLPVAPVEDYQIGQLGPYGIAPIRKETQARTGGRIILYPERPYGKRKWPVDRFLEVYRILAEQGMDVVLMRPPDLDLGPEAACSFEGLSDIAAFFSAGGVFFSNDSGMAHFASRCGLRPLTLFCDADPLVWRPKDALVLDRRERPPEVDEVVAFILSGI